MRPIPRKRAFTLIELVVAVVILAVLAGLGSVAYTHFASDSHDGAALANATQVRKALTAKAAEGDISTAALVTSHLPEGSDDSAALLAYLGVSLDPEHVTYVAGDTSRPAALNVSDDGGFHSQCVLLPADLQTPASVATGACDGYTGPGPFRQRPLAPMAGSVPGDFAPAGPAAAPTSVTVSFETAEDRIMSSKAASSDGTLTATFAAGPTAGTAVYFRMTDASSWLRVRLESYYTADVQMMYGYYQICGGTRWSFHRPYQKSSWSEPCPGGGWSTAHPTGSNYESETNKKDYYNAILDQSQNGVVSTIANMGTIPATGSGVITVTLDGEIVTATAKVGSTARSSGEQTAPFNQGATGIGVGTAGTYPTGGYPYVGGERTFTGLNFDGMVFIGAS